MGKEVEKLVVITTCIDLNQADDSHELSGIIWFLLKEATKIECRLLQILGTRINTLSLRLLATKHVICSIKNWFDQNFSKLSDAYLNSL